MKVLITGSRDWSNWDLIQSYLSSLKEYGEITIIHGNARGADKMAGYIAKKLGYEIKVYPAEWDKFGRTAGAKRNQQVLDENPDINLVIAFPLPHSKGTYDMIRRAEKAGIKIIVVDEK